MEDLVSGFNIMYEFRTLLISFESEYEWRNIVCDEYFNDIELIRWIWQSVKDELIWIKYFTIVFKIYTAVFIIFTQSFNKIYNAGIKPQNFTQEITLSTEPIRPILFASTTFKPGILRLERTRRLRKSKVVGGASKGEFRSQSSYFPRP